VRDVTSQDVDGFQPAHAAAQFQQGKVLALLHYHGVSLNEPDGKGRTVLHWAVFRGDVAITQFLLQVAHVDPLPLDFEQRSPVHFAAAKGLIAVLKAYVRAVKLVREHAHAALAR